MITVNLPDGTKVNFPDGTSQEVMKEALRKRFGGPDPVMKDISSTFQQAVKPRAPDAPDAYKPTTALHSAIASGLQGMTYGFGDELAARVASLHPQIDYEEALPFFRKDLDKARTDHPYITTGSEIAGAVASPVTKLAGAGGTALANLLGGAGTAAKVANTAQAARAAAAAKVGDLPVRMATSALQGGSLAGLYGFGAGEGGARNRLEDAVPQAGLGAAVGAVIPVAGLILQRGLNAQAERSAVKAAARNAPSAAELKRLGSRAYDDVKAAGVQIKASAFDRARRGIMQELDDTTGYDNLPGPGSLTPGTSRVTQIMDSMVKKMKPYPSAAVPFKAVDKVRRQAGAAAGNVTNKTDQQAGMKVIEGLDDFIENLSPDDVVAGDIQALNTALPKARELWTRMTKTQLIEDAIAKGETNYMSGSSSGIRNQFAKILRNEKLKNKFSEVERRAMGRVVNGGNGLERLALLAGGGIGQISQVAMGSSLGPVGTILGAAGAYGSRKLAEVLTAKEADLVRGLMAGGGMKTAPKVSTALRDLMEQRLRLGTAASLQPR